MSKKINNDAMGQLLEGLTSSAVSPVSESSDSTTISESRNNSQEIARILFISVLSNDVQMRIFPFVFERTLLELSLCSS